MLKTTMFSLLLLGGLSAFKVSPAYGQYYVGTQHYPATCASTYQSGAANLIQAAGCYNLTTSQAAINYETARSMELDNQLKGVQTFFEMRRVNTAARKAEEIPGLTTEDSWRIAQANLPKRLTSLELNPVTGKIHWPMMLQDPRYDDYRNQLDHFFVLRETSHGGTCYKEYVQSQQLLRSFLAELQNNLDEYRLDDYVAAKNFLDSLASEAKSPTVSIVSLR